MTTASRPTFDPARGGKSKFESDMAALTKQYSSRDLPGHLTVKYREPVAQPSTSLKRDLEARERMKNQGSSSSDRPSTASNSVSQATAAKRSRSELLTAPSSANPDADDPTVIDNDEDDEPRSRWASAANARKDEDDDDEEDETALLLAELERIKKEREAETAKREAERQADEERAREEALVRGNPLLNGPLAGASSGAASFTVKKRWDDDTVFKNCARGFEDSATKRKRVGYVNDTLRSEFHKRFMDKFIK